MPPELKSSVHLYETDLKSAALICDQHAEPSHAHQIALDLGDSIVNGFSPYHAVKEFSIKKLCLLMENSLDEEFINLLETEISEQAVNGKQLPENNQTPAGKQTKPISIKNKH